MEVGEGKEWEEKKERVGRSVSDGGRGVSVACCCCGNKLAQLEANN